MSKHTRGPWHAFKADYRRGPGDILPIFTIGPGEFYTVAQVRPGNTDDDLPAETEANAILIAAAPVMLAALDPDTLDAIADEIQCFEHSARAGSLRILARKARAAIKLATEPP